MAENIKFDTFNGIDIFVTEDGKFEAKVEGITIKHHAYLALKRKLSQLVNKSHWYEVLVDSGFGFSELHRRRVIVDGDRFRDVENGDLLGSSDDVYHYDDQVEAELGVIFTEYDALRIRYDEAMRKLKRVSRWN